MDVNYYVVIGKIKDRFFFLVLSFDCMKVF